MASLIPNFECDIFISYRHNDNLDGWVTTFVESLEKELRGTLKDTLTIYFDRNPHDGLQQHHEVDDSLREKLKSLILIPIVSQTYCDPKAFAWAHELIPFIQQASEDDLGLKTRVSGGNIASRVLPIKIHDIDNEDRQLFEEATGSVMRSLDFIYKESGVNRPLRPSDDRDRNQEQIDYRNQVNKVANAIKEIISGLKKEPGNATPIESSTAATTKTIASHKIKKTWTFRLPKMRAVTRYKLLAIVSLVALMVMVLVHLSENPEDSRTIRATVLAPIDYAFENTFGGNFALSPDGTQLAFVAEDSTSKAHLWVRNINSLTGQPIKGTEGASFPFWSPDSKSIGFFANGNLKRVDATGGPTQIVCKAEGGRGGSWNQKGVIIFCPMLGPSPLYQVDASGGTPEQLTKLDPSLGQNSHRWPYFLPDGKHFVYCARTATATSGENDGIFLASLDTTFTPQHIAKAGSSVAYANGQLTYLLDQTLMMTPFDLSSLQITGDPIPLVENIYFSGLSAKASFSVSNNGLLVYQTGSSNQTGIALLDRTGTLIKTFVRPSDNSVFNEARFSPNEKNLAISLLDIKSGNTDIWLYDIERDTWTRFTFGPSSQRWPIWSPDGQSVVYSSFDDSSFNLFIRSADSSTSEEILLENENDLIPRHWSPDGKFIIYEVRNSKRGEDLWILPLTGDAKPYPFLQTEFDEEDASFSPDGKWVAYKCDESGRDEVYIRPFPGPGGKWQISTDGGFAPKWRGDGKELYYQNLAQTMAASIELDVNSIEVGSSKELFTYDYGPGILFAEANKDGRQFLKIKLSGQSASHLILVINWPEELKKRRALNSR